MRPGKQRERGAALIVVIFGITLLLLLLLVALDITRDSGRLLVRQLSSQGQAYNAAYAGLTESLSWFVHQPQQPVTAFDPKRNATVNESDDPATGIVRSYEISAPGRVWGRYEVRRTAVSDVSLRRGKTQPGTLWRLDAIGYVYVRNNPALGPGAGPNLVLSRKTMRTEIQRLGLQLPANAAINALSGTAVNVTRAGRVQGGASGIGIAYPPSTGTPTVAGTVTGNPAQATTGGGFTVDTVFGLSQQELVAVADVVVDDETQLPDPLPNMALIVIKGNATFTPQRKLNGSGILVVLGNLNLNPQSDAFFNGVIWVGGNCNISPPSNISGSIVANGNLVLSAGSEVSEVDYDAAILDQVRLQLGNYAFSRAPWVVGS